MNIRSAITHRRRPPRIHIASSYDTNVDSLDDGVVHRQCLNRWEHRNEFDYVWNAKTNDCLGERHPFETTLVGEVQYKREWGGR